MVEGFRSVTHGTTRQREERTGSVADGSIRGELVLYATKDGGAQIQLRASEGTVLLTRAGMAELFDTTRQPPSAEGSPTTRPRKTIGERSR